MPTRRPSTPAPAERDFADLERRLRPLATPLGDPQPGDWLAEHPEDGQTFDQYRAAKPIRRTTNRNAIYLCLVGEFHAPFDRLSDDLAEYVALAFDVPVRVHDRVSLGDIPKHARRTHDGHKQLLSPFLLESTLQPGRPPDALAYLGLTTRDLWAGDGWNFVFGEADLRQRVGVCSVARYGFPGPSAKKYAACLRRTLKVAAHEIGHMLTMLHCTAAACLMNGGNSLDECDGQPLAPCPTCLRKFCWNLQVEPKPYLSRLDAFCRAHGLPADAAGFARFAAALPD
ncbi:MAG: archaemetzincin [Gemmataceae bacterium]|nr:archaemetzincin [Gemmataceae bacterium]